MVSVLASSPSRVKPKIMKLVFVATSLSLHHKGVKADWLVRNQNNVSEWLDMSTRVLLFRRTSTTKL